MQILFIYIGYRVKCSQLKKLANNKPLIWTFHDMWPFCGCEHYAYNTRYSDGYRSDNRSKNEYRFFDINRWRWEKKVSLFKKPIQILSPSRWMTNCIKKLYDEKLAN